MTPYYAAHREERLAYQKAYTAAHRDDRAAYNRAWCEANREERAASRAAFYAANRETLLDRAKRWQAEHREYMAAYRKAHREELALYQKRHRAENAAHRATHKFGEAVPMDTWLAVWNGTCFGCGKTPAEGVDHIIPFCDGGRNVPENLQPACLRCNIKKGPRRPQAVNAAS